MGDGYRIAVKHMSKPSLACTIAKDTKISIVKEPFPTYQDSIPNFRATGQAPPFTSDELGKAVEKLKTGRSPGPDRILPEATKIAAAIISETMRAMYNNLLQRR